MKELRLYRQCSGSLTFLGGFCFDNLGRKKAILVGCSLTTTAAFVGYFCKSYELLLFIRATQGFGNLVSATAVYIWGSEMAPDRYRNHYNGQVACIMYNVYESTVLNFHIITNTNLI